MKKRILFYFSIFLLLLLSAFGNIQQQEMLEGKIGNNNVVSLSKQKYLFLDSAIIQQKENSKIEVGTILKFKDNPLFKEDKPWEPRFDNMYPNVIYDPQKREYKCWYSPFIVWDTDTAKSTPNVLYWHEREMGICYATSVDGIHWLKPKLEIVPWEGGPSNIVMRGPHGAGVFYDTREKDNSRKYKMICSSSDDPEEKKMAISFSSDGLHWESPSVLNNPKVAGDTHNNAFWAPSLNKYVCITREWDKNQDREIKNIRVVARTESSDFINWSDAEIIFKGIKDHLQIYSMPVFYYEGLYIGLPSIYNIKTGRVHVELAWSKDTRNWERISPGKPFIATTNMKGDREWGCIYASSPVIMDNKIRIYYSSSDGTHNGFRKGFFNMASLRSDGFAGYIPVDSKRESSITTKPLLWDGKSITISADIDSGGYIQIELLDENGVVVSKSENITKVDLSDFSIEFSQSKKPITKKSRLKFIFSKAKLYSFALE